MKKVIFVLAILIALTGCGTKKQTLSCTKDFNEAGIQKHQEITETFKNDRISNIKLKVEGTISEHLTFNADQIKKALEKQYSSYYDNGMKAKIEINDNKILIEISMDVDKLSKKQIKANNIDKYANLKSSKKTLEEEGYTCK